MTDPAPLHYTIAEAAAALTGFVNAMEITSDAAYITACATEAIELLENFVQGVPDGTVPVTEYNDCIVQVGADLYFRKTTRLGVVGFGGDDPQPFRVSRDPMLAAYPILRRYIPASGL